ncbi:MAG: dipeptidase [Gemmatimonadota bacterium]|nr:dipeptidase [Gemmatimonadota bacterium]
MFRGSWIVCLSTLLAIVLNPGCNRTEDVYYTKALELQKRILTLDSHVDIPWNYATEEIDPGVENEKLQVDLVKMARGGLDAVFLIAFASQGPLTLDGYHMAHLQVIKNLQAIHRLCKEMHPEMIGLALSPDEVRQIHASGRKIAMIGLENGYPIATDLSRVGKFYELGVRYITLCHIGHNDICDSANRAKGYRNEELKLDKAGKRLLGALYRMDLFSPEPPEPIHDGLSEFGKKAVAKMNRLGIMVDVSHASSKTLLDAVEVSRAPVIASHSCCRALCNISRNIDDEGLRAIAESGGCVQITTVAGYVKYPDQQRQAIEGLIEKLGLREMGHEGLTRLYAEDPDAYQELLERGRMEFRQIAGGSFAPPDVSDLVDHIDHAVEVIGIDHVGLGSDFEGGGGVKDFNSAADAPAITAELLRRGYSEQDIEKIWGGNLLRVWEQVEQVARQIEDEKKAAKKKLKKRFRITIE